MENSQSAGSHHQCWVIFVSVCFCGAEEGRDFSGFVLWILLGLNYSSFVFLKRIYVQE
jgi:hypothetical protein